MKSKVQILAEQIDKVFEERGLLKPKEVKKEGFFVFYPQKNSSSVINKSQSQERN